MNKFRFVVAPKSGGDFTARAVIGVQVDQAALTTALATAAGITGPQVETVITGLFERLLAAAESNQWSDGLYDFVRFRPTAGGRKADPSEFVTAEDINADVSLSFLASAIRAWQGRLNLQNDGTVGKVTPSVSTILNKANGHENEYTAGNMIKVIGFNLAFDPADVEQGVFIQPGAGAEVRLTVYGDVDPSGLTALIPTGTTGALTVRVAVYINGSVRSYTYTDSITASV